MKKSIGLFFTVALMVLALSVTAMGQAADNLREKETTVGFKAGIISPGVFWIDRVDFSTDMSYSFGGFLDYKLAPKISGGLLINISDFKVTDDYDGISESSMMAEFGFALKAWIYGEESSLTFMPGFGINYGALGSNEAIDGSSYFIIHGMLDIAIGMDSFNLLLEIGISGAPAGGNDDYEMTYGPGFTVRGGLVF